GMLARVYQPDFTPSVPDDGVYREYLYEDANSPRLLTGLDDENGNRFASWSYDASGRAILSVHGDEASSVDRVELSFSGNTTTVTGSLGQTTIYESTTLYGVVKPVSSSIVCAGCGGGVSSWSYDANGFVDTKTDFEGNLTDHDYDANGLETQRIEAKNTHEQRSLRSEE